MRVLEAAFIAYPASDLARARQFYETVLNLRMTMFSEELRWVEYDLGAGVTLGVGQYEGWLPCEKGPMVALEVDDFDQSIAALRQTQTHFHMEPVDTPVCRFAIIHDPEGNALMIHKRK
ncbi:MAG: VOC family protein [Vampirovibrionales bacterium]|nr:VOC family protein [Vampirovibrionales bacterium]